MESSPHSCQHCQAISLNLSQDIGVWTTSEGGTLGITSTQAHQAATEGCTLFQYLMRSTPGERVANDPLRYSFKYEHTPTEATSISFLYPAHSSSFEVYAGDEVTRRHFWRPPNLNPSTPDYVAPRWLAKCTREHPECAKGDSNFVPQRLLKITPAQDEVRLLRMQANDVVPYAALSYCWGGDQTCKTLKSNVDEPRRVVEDLPQTIQDAIAVTHQLGLEYLWVDSMCIIQDSTEDKSIQIGQMFAIFSYARVTIAASKASACTEGFLAPRTAIPQFRIPIYWQNGNDKIDVTGTVIMIPSADGDREPLVTRAWTLQELLLSRRILSYGSRQMRWYCASTELCDGGLIDRDSPNFTSFQSLEETVIALPRRLRDTGALERDPTSLPWLGIVEQYTQRDMSMPSDKLVAISAVAQRLVAVTNKRWGAYYAGIWRERFFEQLLWGMTTGEIAQRPAVYRAPTWSWASVDGRPKWPYLDHLVDAKISCELIDVDTRPFSSEDPFGAVSSGHLVVRGKIKHAVWTSDRETMKDSETNEPITDRVMQAFPDVYEENPKEMEVYVLEVAQRSFWATAADDLRFGYRSVPGRYAASLVLQHLGNEIFQRVGFVGLRSVKVSLITMRPAWLKVENKMWWEHGFTKKTITII